MTEKPDTPTPAYSGSTAPSLKADIDAAPPKRFEDLPPAAQRALEEAEARRKQIDARQKAMPEEINGRGGLEPTRYEDWEIRGLTVDF